MIRMSTMLFCVIGTAALADTLTAARLVRANTVIVAADIAMSDVLIPGALGNDAQVVGLETRVTLYPGHPIRPEDVGPPALVERNQSVILVYRRGGLTILAEARSLSRGAVGEVVKAINLSSRTTVVGLVQPDGTVSVSF